MNLIPNQRERRPGLGRTRARFSFKPTTNQPPPNEPSFDVSKYQNPEDFFAAYDKFENASREWQKQTGSSSTNTNQNQPSMHPRRPGISGRVRASYKHRYSTDTINLEASEKDLFISSAQSSLERTTAEHVMPVDREVDDSTIEIEKNVDNTLGELLACTKDELEGDGAVNLLEERLQIKAIDIGKLSLPEFQDVGKIDLKASGRKPSNRKKSPVASLSLRNPMSSPNPLADQFSFPDSRHDTHQLDNLAEDSSREAAGKGRSTVEKDNFPCPQDKSSESPKSSNGAREYVEHIEEQQATENDNTDTACGLQVESIEEVHNCPHDQTNKRRKRGSRDNERKKRSKTVHDESEGDKQMETNASGVKKRIKRKSNEREEKVTREGKVLSRRKSLAAAGTKWETGVRRSTRIKSRPLEYWKGERFLFGRIHESLATVIGIKYESPGKGKSENGKPALKVQSFVSDEYKELIELAALH